MKAIKVLKKDAEKFRRELIESDNILFDYKVAEDGEYLIFPVKKGDFEFEFQEYKKNKTLNDLLAEILTLDELEIVVTSFDSLGNIAIIEIPNELVSKEKKIGSAIIKSNKQITTVVKKVGIHKGVFRTQKVSVIAGVDTKICEYKENGVKLKFNVETVYFSPRLSKERNRISKLVKKDEKILVMFSGCAPYPCVLSKNTGASLILGVEINPAGHKFGLENVKLNKLKNVQLFNADVHDFNYDEKFDRIVMPLPKSADEFLFDALKFSKKGTIIHFYDFLNKNEFNLAEDKVKKACFDFGCDYTILELVKCGQYAPYTFRICLDVLIK